MELKSPNLHYNLGLREIKKLKGNLKLLEIGAGSQVIKDYLPKNILYETLDYASEFYHKKNNYEFDLNKGKIPIKDKVYDLIICNEVLEHLLSPKKIIQEIKRITKDDAKLFFSLPNEYNFVMRLYYLIGKKTKTEEPFEVVEKGLHIHKPRVKDIINLFSQEFKIEKIEYVWQSRSSEKNQLSRILDNLFKILAKVYPSLFARAVVLKVTKK